MFVDHFAQLTTLFAGSLFDTAEAAARDADVHSAHPVTVWRLPTGPYVWATTDAQEVVTESCGLVALREFCLDDDDQRPTEVMMRDGTEWEHLDNA